MQLQITQKQYSCSNIVYLWDESDNEGDKERSKSSSSREGVNERRVSSWREIAMYIDAAVSDSSEHIDTVREYKANTTEKTSEEKGGGEKYERKN